ncbi:MAG: ABC transporter permease [Deltaproteobacteria bacterium]|nr:ABC transporter permease [Deltaproteobacteria bacterium]
MKAVALAVRVGWRGLALRKGRAALMMLGVAIGVVTLTLVVSVGRGAKAKVESGINAFGADGMLITAGSPQFRGPGDERVTTLTPEDATALRARVQGIRVLAPMVVRLEQTLVYQGNNMTAPVIGSTPDYGEAWDWPVVSGEELSEAHEAAAARVAVIGKTIAQELFGAVAPVGESMRIGEQAFKVIGVLAPRGVSPMGMDMDRRVVVPLSTGMRRLFNVSWYTMLRVRATSIDGVDAVGREATGLLRERHHIGPTDTDDFAIRSPATFRAMATEMSGMLTMMLGIITVIALVAGAVVLANILLAAVAERRVEIGLTRALGATKRQIVQQFVVEGLVVTVAGGAVGVAVGTIGAALLGGIGALPAVVTWEPFALALVASLTVGLLASFVPARRAAAIEPATALRP